MAFRIAMSSLEVLLFEKVLNLANVVSRQTGILVVSNNNPIGISESRQLKE